MPSVRRPGVAPRELGGVVLGGVHDHRGGGEHEAALSRGVQEKRAARRPGRVDDTVGAPRVDRPIREPVRQRTAMVRERHGRVRVSCELFAHGTDVEVTGPLASVRLAAA